MIEKHIVLDEKKLYNEVYEKLQKKYNLCYIDYRDEIPARIIKDCLEKKSSDPLHEEDLYWEQRYESAKQELESILQSMVNKPYTRDQIELFKDTPEYDELRYEIEARDESTPVKNCLMQSDIHVRIMLHSNYDCWLPLWETGGLYLEDSALKGILAMLSLNPKKVKEAAIRRGVTVSGRWPNLTKREGKEVVDYDPFIDVLVECSNYGLWTFVGKADPEALWDNDFNTDKMRITKGTTCTMFNDWNGGGSLSQIETIREVSMKELIRRGAPYFDAPKVYIDEKGNDFRGYSTDDVYGGYLSNETALA